MSFDEIAHLDFTLDEPTELREQAIAAWEREKADREHALLLQAQACIHEILGQMNAQNARVTIGRNDDEGTVYVAVAGIEFKVDVLKGGDEVKLFVKVKCGFEPIRNLARLGRMITEGEVRCSTD